MLPVSIHKLHIYGSPVCIEIEVVGVHAWKSQKGKTAEVLVVWNKGWKLHGISYSNTRLLLSIYRSMVHSKISHEDYSSGVHYTNFLHAM